MDIFRFRSRLSFKDGSLALIIQSTRIFFPCSLIIHHSIRIHPSHNPSSSLFTFVRFRHAMLALFQHHWPTLIRVKNVQKDGLGSRISHPCIIFVACISRVWQFVVFFIASRVCWTCNPFHYVTVEISHRGPAKTRQSSCPSVPLRNIMKPSPGPSSCICVIMCPTSPQPLIGQTENSSSHQSTRSPLWSVLLQSSMAILSRSSWILNLSWSSSSDLIDRQCSSFSILGASATGSLGRTWTLGTFLASVTISSCDSFPSFLS